MSREASLKSRNHLGPSVFVAFFEVEGLLFSRPIAGVRPHDAEIPRGRRPFLHGSFSVARLPHALLLRASRVAAHGGARLPERQGLRPCGGERGGERGAAAGGRAQAALVPLRWM